MDSRSAARHNPPRTLAPLRHRNSSRVSRMFSRLFAVGCLTSLVAFSAYSVAATAADPSPDPLSAVLRQLDHKSLAAQARGDSPADANPAERLADDVRQALRKAGLAVFAQGGRELTREGWTRLRDAHRESLRASLGNFPRERPPVRIVTASTQAGDGFAIDNVLYESRPGLWVSANLYRPAAAPQSAPGFVICPAHHTAKTHGELQDMGMTWARLGAYVLVGDQVGHGERREHPFQRDSDYVKSFRLGRQDYYFRYDTGVQAQLVGESLAGQIAWDLSCGADVLLAQPGIDPRRLAILGSVAGGGDPAAIAGALDERFSVVAPFNFGGPQPETRFPLPDDADTWFNYVGGGGWESTRNLRSSASEGFHPWVIVGAVAPRKLIYGHEFSWDRPRDPVWKRLEAIYAAYQVPENLAAAYGRGTLKEQPPVATHCTHIGPEHRQHLHAAFEKWWQIPDGAAREYSARVPAETLRCWTPELREKLRPRLYRQLLAENAARIVAPSGPDAPHPLREYFVPLMDELSAKNFRGADAQDFPRGAQTLERNGDGSSVKVDVHYWLVPSFRQLLAPTLLLIPAAGEAGKKPPVVIAVSSAGKERFLRERADMIAGLLRRGVAVCLPDVQGTGESRPGTDRDRTSAATAQSSSLLMLSRPQFVVQLHELWGVQALLRKSPLVDAQRIGWWGDSLAAPNPPETDYQIPHGVEGRPRESEPAGAWLALFAAGGSNAPVYARGGLVDFRDVLNDYGVYMPHDALVPGAGARFVLKDVAARRVPSATWLTEFVDGQNRAVSNEKLREHLQPLVEQYRQAQAEPALRTAPGSAPDIADWFAKALD